MKEKKWRSSNGSCESMTQNVYKQLTDLLIKHKGMRIIDRCPNCISSSTDDSDETLSDGKSFKRREKVGRNFLTPLAVLILGCDKKKLNDQCEFYYSKFYTAPTIQPRFFCRGKKYEIERKHKVKKRDLLSRKSNVCAISCSELSSSDGIDNGFEGERNQSEWH